MKNDCIQSITNAHIKNMKTIVLTGGGTAGHVIPNLALVDDLSTHFDKIYYIGTNAIEKQLTLKNPLIKFKEISAVKLIRKPTPKNLLIPFKLASSIHEAKKILNEIKPSIIFSKGGFVSVPTVIAARLLKIPVISHESDLSMGLANKIIYHFSDLMLTSFETTAIGKKKCIFVGSPIRDSIFEGDKAKTKIFFPTQKPVVMFFGGSLGAKTINNIV